MNIANFPGTENNYLRTCQMEALPSFLERLSQKKVEVTVAVQGSGKTLYSAACFASAVTLNKGLHAFNLQQIKEEVFTFNQGFGSWEQIKKFVLLSKEFTIEAGELTPTLKLKRKKILSNYQNEYNSIYNR
jgi:hypothetical protein